MRELTDHIVEGDSANHQLKIEVTDETGAGGANHRYEVTGFDTSNNPSAIDSDNAKPLASREIFLFQNGPINEVGVNGITNEVLYAIVIDRLKGFQSGKFACSDNQVALDHTQIALDALKTRTRFRMERGVEGTLNP